MFHPFQNVPGTVYRAAMSVGHFFCHQLPERSPHFWGTQFPLCWRCTGILAGAFVLFLWLFLAKRAVPRFSLSLFLLLLLPVDVLAGSVGLWSATNSSRLITGLLWGVFGTSAILRLVERYASTLLRPPVGNRYPNFSFKRTLTEGDD